MPQRPNSLNPDASPLARFGAQLRARRMQRGWAQAELGRLIHVSGTLIAKMERAERRPQPDVARSLDAALGTDGELAALAADALRDHLLGAQARSEVTGWQSGKSPERASWTDQPNVKAMLCSLADRYDLPDEGDTRPYDDLSDAVQQVIDWRLNSDYVRLIRHVPVLIPELTRALLRSEGEEREAIAGRLVQAWRAAEAIAAKLCEHELASRLILVMGWAASQSGDGLAMAATSYVRAETFFVSGQQQAGHTMLERAAAKIHVGKSIPAAAQYGALQMRAAIAAARAGFPDQAHKHLDQAKLMADLVQKEGVWEGTAFGPASVRIHAVSTAVELKTPQRALDDAGDWIPPDSIPAERRSHYFVDLARAQLAVGKHDAVLATLREAHAIAPQNIQVDEQVHETLLALAGTSPANASAAAGFRRLVAETKITVTDEPAA